MVRCIKFPPIPRCLCTRNQVARTPINISENFQLPFLRSKFSPFQAMMRTFLFFEREQKSYKSPTALYFLRVKNRMQHFRTLGQLLMGEK